MQKCDHASIRKLVPVGVACTRKIKKYWDGRRYPSATSRKRARQTSTSNRLAERTDSFESRIDIRLYFDTIRKLVADNPTLISLNKYSDNENTNQVSEMGNCTERTVLLRYLKFSYRYWFNNNFVGIDYKNTIIMYDAQTIMSNATKSLF